MPGIREDIKSLRGASTDKIILTLNPKIRGWCNYYRHACSSKAFGYIDHQIYISLAQWVHRRHTRRGRFWALKKYFKTVGNCNWVFSAVLKGKDHTRMIRLCRASSITIKRYIKIRGEAHPFNSAFKEYFEKREGNKTRS